MKYIRLFMFTSSILLLSTYSSAMKLNEIVEQTLFQLEKEIAWLDQCAETPEDLEKLAQLCYERAQYESDEESKSSQLEEADWYNQLAQQIENTQKNKKNRKRNKNRLNKKIKNLNNQSKTFNTFKQLADLYAKRAQLSGNDAKESIYQSYMQQCHHAAWVCSNIEFAQEKLKLLIDKASAQDCDDKIHWTQEIIKNYDTLSQLDPSQKQEYYQEKEEWEDRLANIKNQHPGSKFIAGYQRVQTVVSMSDLPAVVKNCEYRKQNKLARIAHEIRNLYALTDSSYNIWHNRSLEHITNTRHYLQSRRAEYSNPRSDILESERYQALLDISYNLCETYQESSSEYKTELARFEAESAQANKHLYLEFLDENRDKPSHWQEAYEGMIEETPLPCFTSQELSELSKQEKLFAQREKREKIREKRKEVEKGTTIDDKCTYYLTLAHLSEELAETYPPHSDKAISAQIRQETEKLIALKYGYLDLFPTVVSNPHDWHKIYQQMEQEQLPQLLTPSEKEELNKLLEQVTQQEQQEKEQQFNDINKQIHLLAAKSKGLPEYNELHNLYTQAVELFPQTYSLEDSENKVQFDRYTNHLNICKNKINELTK